MGGEQYVTTDEAKLLIAKAVEGVMEKVYINKADIKVNQSDVASMKSDVKEIKEMMTKHTENDTKLLQSNASQNKMIWVMVGLGTLSTIVGMLAIFA